MCYAPFWPLQQLSLVSYKKRCLGESVNCVTGWPINPIFDSPHPLTHFKYQQRTLWYSLVHVAAGPPPMHRENVLLWLWKINRLGLYAPHRLPQSSLAPAKKADRLTSQEFEKEVLKDAKKAPMKLKLGFCYTAYQKAVCLRSFQHVRFINRLDIMTWSGTKLSLWPKSMNFTWMETA